MIRYGLVLILAVSFCYAQSSGTEVLEALIPPCSARDLVEVLPSNADVLVYFHDRQPDGSYIFGYILGSGERRYEIGERHDGILYVDGFYSYKKLMNSKYVYETTRYNAGKYGYYPSEVEMTYEPPKIPSLDHYEVTTGDGEELDETVKET